MEKASENRCISRESVIAGKHLQGRRVSTFVGNVRSLNQTIISRLSKYFKENWQWPTIIFYDFVVR